MAGDCGSCSQHVFEESSALFHLNFESVVRWRKKVGRRERLRLNEAIIHEQAQAVDYPGLLSDVLDGLVSMTEENWEERCEELAGMLRGVVAEGG